MEELGNARLEEVMGASAIYKDGKGGVIDDSDKSEGLGGGEAREGVEAHVREV